MAKLGIGKTLSVVDLASANVSSNIPNAFGALVSNPKDEAIIMKAFDRDFVVPANSRFMMVRPHVKFFAFRQFVDLTLLAVGRRIDRPAQRFYKLQEIQFRSNRPSLGEQKRGESENVRQAPSEPDFVVRELIEPAINLGIISYIPRHLRSFQ
jgi:hypothetical protein